MNGRIHMNGHTWTYEYTIRRTCRENPSGGLQSADLLRR